MIQKVKRIDFIHVFEKDSVAENNIFLQREGNVSENVKE